jgi:uncharacterized membrane protein YedE/YeeE
MPSATITEPELTAVIAPSRSPAPYMNPYLAGVGLGMVLLAAFVTMGHGLGASGAVVSMVTAGVNAVAPAHAAVNPFFRSFLGSSTGGTLNNWLVFELLGVVVGGFLSAWLAGRVKRSIEKGPRIGPRWRILNALGGGAVMGFATRLARGCTSGQGLTGGALLNVGSWAFMISLFAGAYLVARVVRRQWT